MEALSFSFAIIMGVNDVWKTKKKALIHSPNRNTDNYILIAGLAPCPDVRLKEFYKIGNVNREKALFGAPLNHDASFFILKIGIWR